MRLFKSKESSLKKLVPGTFARTVVTLVWTHNDCSYKNDSPNKSAGKSRDIKSMDSLLPSTITPATRTCSAIVEVRGSITGGSRIGAVDASGTLVGMSILGCTSRTCGEDTAR